MALFPNLFSPKKVGKVTFRNRIFAAPNMMVRLENGRPVDDVVGFTEAKARGGAAQVTLGSTPCDIEALIALPDTDVEASQDFLILKELALVIKRHGAVASIELIHAGGAAEPFMKMRMIGGRIPMGPTAYRKRSGTFVIEMDEEMIEKTIIDSARAVQIYRRAGFDMIMIQGGHFWLLNQFLSPLWNKRTDRFGGSLENRARFPVMMLDRIRGAIGSAMPIEYRLSGSDLIDGGNRVEDIIEFIRLIEDKIDIIHVSAGSMPPPTDITAFGPYGCNVHLAEKIKRSGTYLPVSVVGNILDPELAEEIIAQGKADFVSMARALVADPELPNKAASGRRDEIIPCIRCFACQQYEKRGSDRSSAFECAVNPRTARRLSDLPALGAKKILVVGGGVAGITAAITADENLHEVTLVERSDALGGLLRFTNTDTVKPDLSRLLRYLLYRVGVSRIRVLLDTDAEPDLVKAEAPDAILVGAGSVPVVPQIPGIERAMRATDVYRYEEKVGQRIIMIGGGMTGCETSLHLANLGREVTVVELTESIARDANPQHLEGLIVALAEKKIKCLTGLNCTEICANGIMLKDKQGVERFLEADTVVYAVGMRPVKDVAERLSGLAPFVISIGDCAHAGNIMDAVYDGFFSVRRLLS
ncbi:MAG: FAD-dependent oxidoreductase [Deltaproteobacteria bacterium]|nr:FAD-dependent oxidoreductase [Deltaproteobacteria bacterium]